MARNGVAGRLAVAGDGVDVGPELDHGLHGLGGLQREKKGGGNRLIFLIYLYKYVKEV